MNENRLTDYLHHMEQAATDACGFVEGLAKEDFLEDKRTQQAVIMSLIIIGEAVTKVEAEIDIEAVQKEIDTLENEVEVRGKMANTLKEVAV